jgi:hypothetical protein
MWRRAVSLKLGSQLTTPDAKMLAKTGMMAKWNSPSVYTVIDNAAVLNYVLLTGLM